MKKALWLAPAALLVSTAAHAVSTELGPGDDIEAAMNALGPGDELVLRGGQYDLSGRFSFSIAGTGSQPILIRAKDGEQPHLHRAETNQNIVDIDSAEHVIIRGIEFSGGSAGVRISAARYLTIEDCEIHHTADVALRANDGGQTYEGLRILRNHIHDTSGTGEGMYLGCNEDGCRLANALIEGNYVHTTNQGVDQGDGIELKEGSHDCVIRDNVIHDTNYPCILTYSAAGNGGPNIIERNIMWGCGNHAIQSAADAVIRNNIILGSMADGIAMQPHQNGSPSNMVVVHNTILHASNDAMSLRGTSGAVTIANNALYAQNGRALYVSGGDTSQLLVSGNGGVGQVQGVSTSFTVGDIGIDLVSASYAGAPPMDLFPTAAGILPGGGDVSHVVADDFNGTARGGVADIGAYAFDLAGNPGWTIAAAFKDQAATPPDAGVADAAAPDVAIADAASPDRLRPDSAESDAAGTDAVGPDRLRPDSFEPSDDAGAGADVGAGADAASTDAGGVATDANSGEDGGEVGDGCACAAAGTDPRAVLLFLVGFAGLTRLRRRS